MKIATEAIRKIDKGNVYEKFMIGLDNAKMVEVCRFDVRYRTNK
jgi:hypothetical protein